MEIFDVQLILLLCAICVVAFFYSSVGHGGASGYLAVLSLFALTPAVMSSTALVLNVLVAGISCVMFARARIFPFRFTLPFLAGSLPASFIGGVMTVPNKAYFLLLGAALIVAAIRLSFSSILFQGPVKDEPPPFALAFIAGAVIGLASGVLGIGGGIFLSPLILFAGWSDAKTSAAVA
ncbi:MAG TPA: sulfite exporter TauE/SafE family protein, partial [Bacteroidota bacterium]|nr:sulfite exporter TauE/SafE family protein [Bacteroidota bacterium]